MKLPTIAFLLFGLGGCSSSTPFLSKEYVWVQNEDGLGMKAPITYRVRPHWAADTLVMDLYLEDSRGVTDIRSEKHWGVLNSCARFNDENWRCVEGVIEGKYVFAAEMKKGRLTWVYWGSERQMKTRYLIWNKPLPF